MSRLAERFEQLRAKNESALIAHLIAGDPEPLRSLEYAVAIEASGADLIALSFPSFDSLTTPSLTSEASLRALQAKTTLKSFFQIIKEFRACSQTPLVLVSHYNAIWRVGEESFIKQPT